MLAMISMAHDVVGSRMVVPDCEGACIDCLGACRSSMISEFLISLL
jgi:hypothetical protein